MAGSQSTDPRDAHHPRTDQIRQHEVQRPCLAKSTTGGSKSPVFRCLAEIPSRPDRMPEPVEAQRRFNIRIHTAVATIVAEVSPGVITVLLDGPGSDDAASALSTCMLASFLREKVKGGGGRETRVVGARTRRFASRPYLIHEAAFPTLLTRTGHSK